MENASKALIIAGAILISILIVGLGVIIYNNVSGIAQSGTLDAQEIQAHNSPFEGYFGNNVSGSNVRALITQVNANNNSARADNNELGNFIFVVTPTSSGGSSYTLLTSSNVKTGKTYNVSILSDTQSDTWTSGAVGEADAGYWKNGFIKTIVVSDPTTTP